MMENMYMTLPSNTTTDLVENTPSEYRVKLPIPVELSGEWEMALVEMHYPHSWDNIGDDLSGNTTQNCFMLRMKAIHTQYKDGVTFKYTIPPTNYDTVSGLVDAINESLATTSFTIHELLDYNNCGMSNAEIGECLTYYQKILETEGAFIQFEYSETKHRVVINNYGSSTKEVFFSPLLQYVLGFDAERWVHVWQSQNVASYPPDLTAGFNTLYVYCNLIESQIVGNSLVPILRIVTIEGKHGDSVNKIFLSPHCARLRTKTFDSVEVAVKTDTDNPVRFRFGKVILKVHLRKIHKS